MIVILMTHALAMDPLASIRSTYDRAYPKVDPSQVTWVNTSPFVRGFEGAALGSYGSHFLWDRYGAGKDRRMRQWATMDAVAEIRKTDKRLMLELRKAVEEVGSPEHEVFLRHHQGYKAGQNEAFNRSQRRRKVGGWAFIIMCLTDIGMRAYALSDHRDPGYLATPLLKPIEVGIQSGLNLLTQEGE